MNRRLSATDASGTVYFHYDGASPDVTAETDEDGAIIATYMRDTSGRLVSMKRGAESYHFHLNARGDVIALTDDASAIVNGYRYDPYGNVLEATETVENPYRYAGYRFDEASGLYHLWNRYYDPRTAHFITKDVYPGVTTRPGTMNSSSYCLGDPVNLVDPWGWAGYANINGVAPIFGPVGISAGLLIADDGLYPYIGPALTTSPGISFFGSAAQAEPGWYGAVQGGDVLGASAGTYLGRCARDISLESIRMPDSFSEAVAMDGDQTTFWEVGLTTPGASAELVYVGESWWSW